MFDNILRRMDRLPDGVRRVRFRFGEDWAGDPAVWIGFVADDDLKPSKEKIADFQRISKAVSDEIRPGVVQMATGAWYDPEHPGRIGSLDKHGNPNVLTLDKGTSRLAQGPSAQTTLVEIEKFSGEPPPVTAFEAPLSRG